MHREPKIRSLPRGWDKMDSMRFNNITGISGIQQLNDPMSVPQNSTYSCKNVYQNDAGNLTVRPALRWISTFSNKVLAYYDTTVGRLLHITKNGKYYITDENDHETEIGQGKITVQESDTNVYIMYTDLVGKLSFKIWNDGLQDFEPVIQTNDPANLSTYRFNLLTNKYYNAIPVFNKQTAFLPWNSYDVSYTAIFSMSEEIIYNVFLDGKQYIITSGGQLYIISNTILVIQISDYTMHSLPSHKSDYCIWLDTNKTVYLTMFFANSKILEKYVVTTQLSNKTEFDLKSTTFATQVVLAHDKVICLTEGKYGVADISTKSVVFTQQYKYTQTVGDKQSWGYTLDIPCFTHNTVVFLNTDALQSANSAVDVLQYEEYNYITKAKSYKRITATIRSSVFDSTCAPIALNSPITCGYMYTYTTSMRQLCLITDTVTGEMQYEMTSVPTAVSVYGSDSSITINCKFEREHKFFAPDYATNEIKQLDIPGYTDGGVYENGSILFVKDTEWNLLRRTVKLESKVMLRPQSDDFPVLSDLNDEVLTSFYLDNVYWFVTKQRVFGTGVANEQFSIKYFDPRKYFYFEETLTGAIRISDSGFWVFHSNGAYLIYKGTSDLYEEASQQYVNTVTWLCTNTAKSKGCDFDNGVITLPVTNYVSCITSDDISVVQMRENVQTDDRILVPMTLNMSDFVASLLNETASVVTGRFKYNALYFLNPQQPGIHTPVLVYNAAHNSWWYWELPVSSVTQANETETGIRILAEYSGKSRIYDLYENYYSYRVGGIAWWLYADRLDSDVPHKINWYWESALLHFDTLDYRKQLLYTNFTLNTEETSTATFEYNFEVFDDVYSARDWLGVNQVVSRARSYSCKDVIAKFMFLQLYLRDFSDDSYDTYTKPEFSSISFKYRILPGGLL